ncbi:hypothetical protein D3C71_1805020 [compost metagenome]
MQALGFASEVVLHAKGTAYMVARLVGGVVGGNNLANTQRAHHLAPGHGRDVGLAFVHPAAHGRVQRQVQVAHQHLAFAGLFGGHGLEAEVVTAHGADRAFGEQEAAVGVGHGGSFGQWRREASNLPC